MTGRSIAAVLAGLAVFAAGGAGLAQDRYYASSFIDGTVYEIDFTAGTATAVVGGFAAPEDITCKEATEQLFICDSLISQIVAFDIVGGLVTNIIPAAGGVAGPEGPSISPSGDLYFNTRGAPLTATGIWSVPDGDPTNAVVNVVPTYTTFGEGSGFGTAGSSAGGLLGVDRANGRVVLSNPPGAAPIILISGLVTPFGVAVDSVGDIYVTERPAGRISKWTPDGVSLGNFVTGLSGPTFLEIDSLDNVVVALEGDNSVLQYDSAGALLSRVTLLGAVGVAICRAAAPLPPCPHSQGFWKNHEQDWPVTTLSLGAETYTQSEALALLRTPVRGDASLILSKQLIAAKLNIENGSDPAPVGAEIADGDALFGSFPGKLPYGIHPSTVDGHTMTALGGVLDEYNNKLLTSDCEDTEDQGLLGRSPRSKAFCGGIVGSPTPRDFLGAMLPFLLLGAALLASKIRGSLQPTPG